MTRVFVYEFLCGGGLMADSAEPPASLWREGRAMLSAAAADFAACPGVDVATMLDARLPFPPLDRVEFHSIGDNQTAFSPAACGGSEARLFADLAARCDWTLLIAPELADQLAARCRRVLEVGGRLLSPGLEVVSIASDKHRTAEHLAARGVPVPEGVAVGPGTVPVFVADRHGFPKGVNDEKGDCPPRASSGARFQRAERIGTLETCPTFGTLETCPTFSPYPAVLKPRFGAGSQGVRLIERPEEIDVAEPSRLERYCPGTAASVAFLCGPAGRFPLVPCRQHLSADGRFTYQGGSLPLPPPLADRAVALGRRAVAAIPPAVGYLGIDLVLGNDEEGSDDVVIEVNPRLTTSYVGLRAAAAPGVNLAAAMHDVAEGRTPRLSFLPDRLQFDPEGRVRRR